jgi:hypothetical protein
MKKKPARRTKDELRPEYDLRQLLANGVRGKYASRYAAGTNVVLLAPDVAKAFPNPEAVNDALRLVMKLSGIPRGKRRSTEHG